MGARIVSTMFGEDRDGTARSFIRPRSRQDEAPWVPCFSVASPHNAPAQKYPARSAAHRACCLRIAVAK